MSTLAHFEKGLSKEELIVLAVLTGINENLKIKIMEKYTSTTCSLSELKIFSDTIVSSTGMVLWGLYSVLGTKATSNRNPCSFCKRLGHDQPNCYNDPSSQRYKLCTRCSKGGHTAGDWTMSAPPSSAPPLAGGSHNLM